MARPSGITLTPSESEVLLDWRDARDGTTEDLADQIGVTRQHFSGFLNGSRSLARRKFYHMLRVLRAESFRHFAHLEALGAPETKKAIASARSMQTHPVPLAGRGRATMGSPASG